MERSTRVGAAFAAIIASGLLMAGCAAGPQAGTPAPAFSVLDAQGEELSLKTIDGQVAIIDFWAVW
ncbi:MAG: TlpA family protein disulfide reductase [Planctomycetota bacterium]|jgi:cytochrome oxidase Cu insertion factor (SCO1/SenC/PrrC family)